MRLRAAPRVPADADALPVLEQAFRVHRLAVAGPVIPFDARTALAAASLVQHAAWYLLNPGLPIEAPQRVLGMPPPTEPAQHLSADLVLLFLPAVQRRAQALLTTDVVPQALAQLLRHWPLSGVLSELQEGPLTPLDFGGHPGLLMLYAERLARHERPAWFPDGPAAAYVELVWQQLGRDTSLLPHLQGLARTLAEEDRKEDA